MRLYWRVKKIVGEERKGLKARKREKEIGGAGRRATEFERQRGEGRRGV